MRKNNYSNIPNVLVHFHLYYHEQIDFFIKKLKNIDFCKWDLFVTYSVDDIKSNEKLLKLKPDTHFRKLRNCGYDILPFFTVLNSVNLDDYDYVLKLHTKNYYNNEFLVGSGYTWRNLLVDALIGSKRTWKNCLSIMDKNKDIGMIGANECIRSIQEDSDIMRANCSNERFGNINNSNFSYIAGTMFLCKSVILKILKEMCINENDFSNDIQMKTNTTGQFSHIVERLIGKIVTYSNLRLYGIANHRYLLCKKIKKIVQTIFSIKNSYDKKHKIITLLGFKLSFKSGN